jgi:hypothetical protein
MGRELNYCTGRKRPAQFRTSPRDENLSSRFNGPPRGEFNPREKDVVSRLMTEKDFGLKLQTTTYLTKDISRHT